MTGRPQARASVTTQPNDSARLESTRKSASSPRMRATSWRGAGSRQARRIRRAPGPRPSGGACSPLAAARRRPASAAPRASRPRPAEGIQQQRQILQSARNPTKTNRGADGSPRRGRRAEEIRVDAIGQHDQASAAPPPPGRAGDRAAGPSRPRSRSRRRQATPRSGGECSATR